MCANDIAVEIREIMPATIARMFQIFKFAEDYREEGSSSYEHQHLYLVHHFSLIFV